VALFYCTAALASMFSGYLQAGVYQGLDGKMGKQGWQVSVTTGGDEIGN
jgi:ACS family pantothenate transporter-like MFS transporter